jgi:hypothetical protein
MLCVGVKCVAIHVLGELVCGASAIRSLKKHAFWLCYVSITSSLRTSEWIFMKSDASFGVNRTQKIVDLRDDTQAFLNAPPV